jgi:tetratricopeptide (TPR) repeat protein
MTDRQLTFETNDIAHLVNNAYGKLRVGAFGDAARLLERALELDVEYEGITATLKSVRFWGERRRRLEDLEERDRAAYLLDQWAAFRGFAARIEDLPPRCYQDIKYYVHATAVAYLQESVPRSDRIAAGHRDRRPRDETRRLFLLGHAYKAMGDFVNAIANLERASKLDRDWAPVLAELADSYSLIGENRAAQVFFREAFYRGAAEICIEQLDCVMIRKLTAAIGTAGVRGAVAEWIPVYGTLLGAFSVSRELGPLEFGHLLQSIFELEQQLGLRQRATGRRTATETRGERGALVPRLLNRYFWLIEHYRCTGEEQSKVADVLRRIKVLDADIHRQYVA